MHNNIAKICFASVNLLVFIVGLDFQPAFHLHKSRQYFSPLFSPNWVKTNVLIDGATVIHPSDGNPRVLQLLKGTGAAQVAPKIERPHAISRQSEEPQEEVGPG